MKLLIADDDAGVRSLVHLTLEADEHEILEADNGVTALGMAVAELPDVVLLDVMMPGMNGLDVCRALKSDHATSHIVIVMLTAQAQENDRAAGASAGADDYFTKPFSPLALLHKVQELAMQAPRE